MQAHNLPFINSFCNTQAHVIKSHMQTSKHTQIRARERSYVIHSIRYTVLEGNLCLNVTLMSFINSDCDTKRGIKGTIEHKKYDRERERERKYLHTQTMMIKLKSFVLFVFFFYFYFFFCFWKIKVGVPKIYTFMHFYWELFSSFCRFVDTDFFVVVFALSFVKCFF